MPSDPTNPNHLRIVSAAVAHDEHAELAKRANAEGRTLSQELREALRAYLGRSTTATRRTA